MMKLQKPINHPWWRSNIFGKSYNSQTGSSIAADSCPRVQSSRSVWIPTSSVIFFVYIVMMEKPAVAVRAVPRPTCDLV